MDKLFFKNDFKTFGVAPDPFMLYDNGTFYLYYTGGRELTAYRSRNFVDWEFVGTVFKPELGSWIFKCLWAPEVVKFKDGKYYMYVTATGRSDDACPEGMTTDGKNGTVKCRDFMDGITTAVLVADSPEGPFKQWTGERPTIDRYYHGEKLGVGDMVAVNTYPLFDFANTPEGWALNKRTYEINGTNVFSVLDASPFTDDDGTLYMYFVRSHDSNSAEHSVWGVKMLDPLTPDYSTLVKLTEPRKLYPDGPNSYDGYMDGKLNEGPYVVKRGDTYYMAYSAGDGYNTGLAISDSPLGRFTKLAPKYGNPILRVSPEFGFYNCPEGWGVFGAGHGMICKVGDEEFFVSLTTRPNVVQREPTSRTAMFDKLIWRKDEELGIELPFINGPTYNTLQPVPSIISGYSDIALLAKVDLKGQEKRDVKILTDGIIPVHKRDDGHTLFVNGEFIATLEFQKPYLVKAIMVYNARTPKYAFSKIDEIVLENGEEKTILREVEFPREYLIGNPNAERRLDKTEFQKAEYWEKEPLTDGGLLPAGAVIAEFEEKTVKKITVKITEKLADNDCGIGISAITVLGKKNEIQNG